MSIEGDTSNPRAPEERNVYSKSRSVFLKPQRGGMCRIGLMHDKSRKTIFRSSGAQCGGGTSIHAIAQVQLTD